MPDIADILTVTLNPALDIATAADHVRPGPKLRCDPPAIDPGGGGVNVARVIRRLGTPVRALVAVAGPTGERLVALMRAERVETLTLEAPEETRLGLAVTDRATGGQYRFAFPGPAWTKRRAAAIPRIIAEAAQPGGFVVLSGSQPPGFAADFPERVARALARVGARLVIDTSGPALARLAEAPPAPAARPYVLRMDSGEAEALAGHPLPGRADTADFAQDLARRGAAEIVVVARGADGSTLATATSRIHAAGAPVPVVSKVGAGDSFVGAFTRALARGAAPARALQEGSAAASAAVTTPATELCRPREVRRLITACALCRV